MYPPVTVCTSCKLMRGVQGDSVTTVQPPPEAALIEKCRRQAGLSARQAAIKAGVSPTFWREVERGISRASDETLAAMAAIIWAAPEDLASAGRPGAAAELSRLLDAEPHDETRDEVRSLVERVARSRQLTERQKRALAERIMREISDGG